MGLAPAAPTAREAALELRDQDIHGRPALLRLVAKAAYDEAAQAIGNASVKRRRSDAALRDGGEEEHGRHLAKWRAEGTHARDGLVAAEVDAALGGLNSDVFAEEL